MNSWDEHNVASGLSHGDQERYKGMGVTAPDAVYLAGVEASVKALTRPPSSETWVPQPSGSIAPSNAPIPVRARRSKLRSFLWTSFCVLVVLPVGLAVTSVALLFFMAMFR